MRCKLIGLNLLVGLSICGLVRAEQFAAANTAQVLKAAASAKPGDVIVMTDGTWSDQAIVFKGKGTPDKPITLQAQTPGKVILTGQSTLDVEGENLVVSGLLIKDCDGNGNGDNVHFDGVNNRLTDSAIIHGGFKFMVHLYGERMRMDHCYIAGKTTGEPTLQIEAPGKPNHDEIDHNDFGPRPPLGRNGGETMRVGYSGQSMNSSMTTVEQNLFDRCDGEIEIISSKSCDNIYRNNTFLNSGGMLTLRHGNRALVEGNFFFGQHKKGSGGIRVIGEDHTIINNYIDGVEQGAIWITAGIQDSPLNGYFRAKNAVIAFNTIVDCKGPNIDLDAGMGTSRRTLMPQNITIANNLISIPANGSLFKGKEGENYTWQGNLVMEKSPETHDGITFTDVKLKKAEDNLWRPLTDSPAIKAAAGSFPKIKTDIDGQPRTAPFDVGCDQVSDAPITNRPLTAADVGPSWMKQK